jgi:hypothetical protein
MWGVLLVAAAVGAPLLGLIELVAHWGTGNHWMETHTGFADFSVAFGTLGLAVATVILSGYTHAATRVAGREIETTIRPLLVQAPFDAYVGNERGFTRDYAKPLLRVWRSGVFIDFAMRNDGSGPALISGRSFSFPAKKDLGGEIETTHTVIPAGEVATLTLSWQLPKPAETEIEEEEGEDAKTRAARRREAHQEQLRQLQERSDTISSRLEVGGRIDVQLDYSDLNGGQPSSTIFVLEARTTEEYPAWEVSFVKIFRSGESEPFLTLAK